MCVYVCSQRGWNPPSKNREAASPLDGTAARIGIVQYYFKQSVIVHLRYLWNNMPSC